MIFSKTEIEGVYVIELEPFQDERGFFSRIFCEKEFGQAGLVSDFVQVNHSTSRYKGTIRGLHFQLPPHSEVKVLRCVRGSLYDVIVDIRKNSLTFLEHFKIELSESNHRMLYIPTGFAHGFQTLSDNTSLIYFHSDFYHPSAEKGLKYNDPRLSIEWPLPVSQISKKDQEHNYLSQDYQGIEI